MRKKLTNKKINKLCDEIIERINLAIENDLKIFLCNVISPKLNCENEEIVNFIPKFNYENAAKHANAFRPSEHYSHWWSYKFKGFNIEEENIKVNQNKLLFMQWLKSQYPVTPKK